MNSKAAGVLAMLVFVGLAEEFKYRGYIQHRLNVAFGKPFKIFGFKFGWGLILASLIFGMGHVIEPGESLQWAWGMWTTISGLCFGIIREKGGGFLSSAIVHGIIMTFPVLFS
jgi:membrane protease YdiL (CAAX protease family)